MEVHPPEHPIHTWRDFFIHIATIVVGLLIAIGLEQSVEWLHHRHLLHVAREQIQEEIHNNRKIIVEDRQFLVVAANDVHHNLDLLSTPPALSGEQRLKFGWRWSAPNDSAWRTAQQSGALSYMPLEEMQRDAQLYQQMSLVEIQAERFIHTYSGGLAPIIRHGDLRAVPLSALSAQERATFGDNLAQDLIEIGLLQDLAHELEEQLTATEGRTRP